MSQNPRLEVGKAYAVRIKDCCVEGVFQAVLREIRILPPDEDETCGTPDYDPDAYVSVLELEPDDAYGADTLWDNGVTLKLMSGVGWDEVNEP